MTFAGKRPFVRIVVSFVLVALTTLTQSATVLAQNWHEVSADLDGDGLPDLVEERGWYNASGGPFVTAYTDPDSDDDGLSDGYEKLYETNPLDDHSPGIYVEYQDNFRTQEYFPWQRYGNRLATFPSPYGSGSLVVRRGTTFSVGGPVNAEIEIRRSKSSLTPLTAVRNACASRWEISVPANGTVGIYTLHMNDGSWSQNLNLYVIFQLPTNRSSAFVQAFVYDDNPDNTRDETSIHYSEYISNLRQYDAGDGSEYAWIPPGQWVNHGYGWNFLNEQYEPYIFVDHVIQAINGQTTTWGGADALAKRVDQVTCFHNPAYKHTSYCTLHPGLCSDSNATECTSIASLLTAFDRSAGIAARPLFTDWRYGSFDHSTEVWVQSPEGLWDWYITKGYTADEWSLSGGCPTPSYTGGSRGPTPTINWYSGDISQGVYAASENWPWSDVGNFWSEGNDDFRQGSWDLDRENQVGKIVKKSWWETRFVDYWGWPTEPQVIGSPPGAWPEAPGGVGGLSIAPSSESSVLQFDQVNADYGVDVDGDGRFDQLVFEIQVGVAQAGDYWFRGTLGGAYAPQGTGHALEAISHFYLTTGTHTVELRFDGTEIYLSKANGPYNLDGLWATDIESPIQSDFLERELAYMAPDYQTAPYQFADFGVAGATLPDDYNHYAVDSDGDGYADTLIVEANLNIDKAGTYTVQGVLYGGQGEHEKMLSHATWTGSGASVTLRFEGLKDSVGPYVLPNLNVRNEAGQTTDSITEPIVLGEIPEFSAKPISLGVETAVPSDIGAAFLITGGYAATRLDTDGNGKFDQLVISTAVEVQAGEGGQAYRLEGWLVDQHNDLVAWAISDPKVLSQGTHSLSLAFDGRIINEHGVDGPFTLVALKALPGNTYTVLNQVDVAFTTPAYSHDEFEGPVASTVITPVFRDNMENGSGQWSAASPWTLSNDTWSSYSHAWKAVASGSQTASLSLSLNMPEYTTGFLTFQTCYVMQSANDVGYLEVSTDNTNWTRIATYTDSTPHWSTQFLAWDHHDTNPTLQLRFKAQFQNGVRWYIDDVSVSSQRVRLLYLPLILK